MLLAALAAVPLLSAQIADTILTNGRIYTLWSEHPVAEAVAIQNGRFLAVGAGNDMTRYRGPSTKIIDLHGRTAVPGLNDSHTHPISAALSERDGEIPVMNSIADVQKYVAELAKRVPPEGVIFVPKVYSTRMRERRYPTRHDLDAAAPGRVAVADNGQFGRAG
jgi:predicted amidohydrolase YtcJ